jgi:hypothetical protein
MACDIGSRQVHGSVAAFERGQIGDRRGMVRSPFDLDGTWIGMGTRRTPHQQHDLHTVPDEILGQRSPDETGSPAYEKLALHVRSARRLGCGGRKLAMALNAASI